MTGASTIEGAGARVRRAFGVQQARLLDPFLLLDEIGADGADFRGGFPQHPHRGIETVTCVLAGSIEHRDTLGGGGVIGPGDVQWMTAGGGVIHEELPGEGEAAGLRAFQLWVNLPASQKMSAPRYRDLRAAEIPVAAVPGGGRVRVVAGSLGEVRGPAHDVAGDAHLLDAELPAGGTLATPIPRGRTVFCYVYEGSLRFAEGEVPAGSLALFGDGDEVILDAADRGARVLLASGQPSGEPIAWWGPIVMNGEDELRAAVEEYQNGTFARARR